MRRPRLALGSALLSLLLLAACSAGGAITSESSSAGGATSSAASVASTSAGPSAASTGASSSAAGSSATSAGSSGATSEALAASASSGSASSESSSSATSESLSAMSSGAGTSGTATESASGSTGAGSAMLSASGSSSAGASGTASSSSSGTATAAAVPTVAGVPTPTLVTAAAGTPGGTLAADAIINVARKATPGVVQITNEQVQLGSMGGQAVPAGVGTGIVLDRQGHILTNNHVVAGAQKLVVSLSNGSKELPATLVGADPRSDLAVVQVQGVDLTPLELGDSSKLQVGQWVVAIGNALALPGGPTTTVGVVSALGRTVQEPAPNSQGGQGGQGSGQGSSAGGPFLFDVVQTSAPINPGNSGGPLVDLAARVVGINTLVAGQAEPGVQAQGIGFAIAINTAKKIADQLIAQGKVNYAFLGVGVVSNTPALAQQYGFPSVPGALVGTVAAGSPAQQAGLARGDVITSIGGHAIKGDSDLFGALEAYKPGDKVTVTWVQVRTNQQTSKEVTLAQAPQP